MGRKFTDNVYARLPTEIGGHDEFLDRISKTLYYTKLPATDCLSLPVTELAAEIFTDVKHGPTLDHLDVEEAGRISRNACVSPCSLVMALIYIERLKDCNPEYLQRVAPSELFLVSLMVASKFLHDEGEEDDVYNAEWAKSGDLSIAKLNKLEREFLKAIKWTVFVDHEDFWKRLQRLEEDLAIREARKRGWFSYTELNTLLDSANLLALAQTVLGVSSMCIATYAAGLMTLLGSATVASSIPRTFMSLGQQSLSSGISDHQCTALTQENLQVEEEIANILLESSLDKTEVCNQTNTQGNVFVCNCNDTVKENGWGWLIEVITPWLNNFNQEFKCKSDWENNFHHDDDYSTKKSFISESDPYFRFSKIDKRKKKVLLHSSLNYYKHDMKYYIGYFPKYLKSLTVM
ncbi:protein CNPPD1 [Copidosoma floridanum]|uniref:protein CNPPD1 n=1 Tax=Copidosoma floridanum TaxID=29053 RepID=UPI0006C9BEE2|nr:protein CNPPD1 [Copidosoma floridanum]